MDPEIRAKILDRPRAKELDDWELPQPTLEEVRRKYGAAGLSDEELLLRFFAGPSFVDALQAAPPRKAYLDARQPIVRLLEELSRQRNCGHIAIRKGNFSLSMGRQG